MRKWVDRTLNFLLNLRIVRGHELNGSVNPSLINTSYTSLTNDYPWYQVVNGEDLAQGDILFNCPVPELPPNYLDQLDNDNSTDKESVQIIINFKNVIVMTQSCDLAIQSGKCKVEHVLLCPVYFKNQLTYKDDIWENARQGKIMGLHVLNRCDIENHIYDFMLVDLKRTYSIDVKTLRRFASEQESRIRLLPPYREHLSQSFARFFMRVGLPVDIPSFTKSKK